MPSIPTTRSRRKIARRLDRRSITLGHALSCMRGGDHLTRVHDRIGVRWLVGDMQITDKLAAALIVHPQIVAVGDALSLGLPASFSQTFVFQPTHQQQ